MKGECELREWWPHLALELETEKRATEKRATGASAPKACPASALRRWRYLGVCLQYTQKLGVSLSQLSGMLAPVSFEEMSTV